MLSRKKKSNSRPSTLLNLTLLARISVVNVVRFFFPNANAPTSLDYHAFSMFPPYIPHIVQPDIWVGNGTKQLTTNSLKPEIAMIPHM